MIGILKQVIYFLYIGYRCTVCEANIKFEIFSETW